MWKRFFWTFLFAAIFLLGLAMRSPEILGGNYLFGFDQGQNYMKAYDIAVNHKFTLIGSEVGSGSAGVPGLFHGPGFYYILALALLLFHGDPYGGLVLMWVSGVATLILVFLTVRRMFGEKTALTALFLVAIAPLIAPQSRFMWGPHMASVLMVLYYYFLYKIPDKPVVFTFWAMATAGLLYHFELALSVPLVLLTGVSVIVYRQVNKKVIASAILAIMLAYAPMILFEARHGFQATHGIIANITTKKRVEPVETKAEPNKQGDFYLSEKKDQFISNFRDSFIFEYGKIPPPWYNTAILAVSLVILLALIKSGDHRARRYFILILLAIPITFIVFLPLRGPIWPYFLIHLHFVYIYAFAYASICLLQETLRSVRNFLAPLLPSTSLRASAKLWFPESSETKGSKRAAKISYPPRIVSVVASIFIIFFFLSMSQGLIKRLDFNWNVDYGDYGGKDKIKGKRAIIDYVYADAKGQPFSVFVFMPPVYTWPYDYLFLTYAKDKYGYMPSHEKKGLAYMIIELDGGKPWSYKGWLETVIKTGTPVWERYIKETDHVLQKRVFD
jgi:hypothetical protein